LGGKYMVVDRIGASLSVREGRFVLRVREGRKWSVIADAAPTELDTIIIATDKASVTASALTLAAKHGIDVVIMTWEGPVARLLPASYGSIAWLWLEQLRQREDPARRAELASAFVEGKVRNQAYVIRLYRKAIEAGGRRAPKLRKIYDELLHHARQARKARDWREAAQEEAAAARKYWEGVAELIPRELGFTRRLKRWSLPEGEVPDPFNTALNIGYAALAKEVWRATFAAGLNPYVGYLHERRPGRLSLVYDLMEEFRPVAVDKPLIRLARKNPSKLKPLSGEDEDKRKQAAREVWKTIVTTLRDTQPPLKNTIMTQARKLAKAIRDRTPYHPFMMRH